MSCSCNKCGRSSCHGGCVDLAGLERAVYDLTNGLQRLEELFTAEEIARMLAELCEKDVKGCTSIADLRECLLKEFRKAPDTRPGDQHEIYVRTFDERDECREGEQTIKVLQPDLARDDEFLELAAWSSSCPTACDNDPKPQLRRYNPCATPQIQAGDVVKPANILIRERTCPSGETRTECRVIAGGCPEEHTAFHQVAAGGGCFLAPPGTKRISIGEVLPNPPAPGQPEPIPPRLVFDINNPYDCPALFEMHARVGVNRFNDEDWFAPLPTDMLLEGVLYEQGSPIPHRALQGFPSTNDVFKGQVGTLRNAPLGDDDIPVAEATGRMFAWRLLQPGESLTYQVDLFIQYPIDTGSLIWERIHGWMEVDVIIHKNAF